jgi:hypothetical protein
MTKAQYDVLTQIFNALQAIDTKGQNTIIMADVLRALQQLMASVSIEPTAADMEPQTEEK